MAVPGDAVSGIVSVAPNATYDIKPLNVGEEWVVHNIYYNQANVQFYMTDGNLFLFFDEDITDKGARLGASFHVTNSYWIQMKNTATTNTIISFDGVQTK